MPLYEFLVVLAEPYAMAPSSAGPTRRVSSRQAPGPPATYTTRWDSPVAEADLPLRARKSCLDQPEPCPRLAHRLGSRLAQLDDLTRSSDEPMAVERLCCPLQLRG